MNIMINNYCNLNCEYCFANKIIEKEKVNMTIEDFRKVLFFLNSSKYPRCNIIGGEPTLHPKFNEMLHLCVKMDFITHVHIFSNGLFNDHILEKFLNFSKQKKLSFLINYNLPEILLNRINIVKKNVEILRKNYIDVTLGINFYKKDQPYQYLIDACLENNIKCVRWSLVVPNSVIKAKVNVRRYFTSFSPGIVQFINACAENGITPVVDCNNIPLCMINNEDIKFLAVHANNSLRVSVCSPVIDILPRLKVLRCFALSNHAVDLDRFENMDDIQKYFEEIFDKKLESALLIPECADCLSFKYRGKSCGCLAYKLIQ